MRRRLFVCLALVLSWNAYAQWGAPEVGPIPIPALQNAIVAERVRAAQGGETWLVGSSLIGQLPPGEIGRDVRSAALSGGDASTALRLLAHARSPRTIVVETDRLLAEPDTAYADSLWGATHSRWLAVVRGAQLGHRPSTHLVEAAVRLSAWWRRREPESVRARREAAYVAEWLQVGVEPDHAALDRRAVAAKAELDRWRARGIHVVLLEMPMNPVIRMGALESASRAAIDSNFSTRDYPRVVLPAGSWRTSDGRHLEPADALRVARAVADALR